MATATSRGASSTRSSHNGSARTRAVSRRASSTTQSLQTSIARESRALGRRAGAVLSSALRGTRRHPYAVAGALLGVAAAIGGYFWARQR